MGFGDEGGTCGVGDINNGERGAGDVGHIRILAGDEDATGSVKRGAGGGALGFGDEEVGLAGFEMSMTARESRLELTTYAYLPETKMPMGPSSEVPGVGPWVSAMKVGLAGLLMSMTARESRLELTTYAYLPETKMLRAPSSEVPGVGPWVSAMKVGVAGLDMSMTAREARVMLATYAVLAGDEDATGAVKRGAGGGALGFGDEGGTCGV